MRRHRRLRPLAAAAVALPSLTGCARTVTGPPDVVLVTVDTLRTDHLGGAGRLGAHTPWADALIRRGTWFAEAITPMPRTSPAIGSLLTGRWPSAHGSRAVGAPIRGGTTLAEALSRRGYQTIGVSASAVAGPGQELDRGYARFADVEEIRRRHPVSEVARFGAPAPVGWAEATTRTALELLDEARPEAPLHLWVHYWDPHMPYRPPDAWLAGVEAPRCWELYETYTRRTPGLMWRVRGGFDPIAGLSVDHCRRLYDAEIAYTDHEIGRLVEKIADRRGRPALIVFTSDHGENFGEEGSYFEHGDNAHDSALRVPLVVSGPGVAAGRVDQGSASLVDVAPTLLALLGVPGAERPPSDGRDLSGRLREAGAPRSADDPAPVFAESGVAIRNRFFRTLLTGRASQRACINGERYTLCDVHDGEPGVLRLYDHEADPGLTRDVADRNPDIVARLREARTRWPVEEARIRTARTPRFKLVQRPRVEGGYREQLFDLGADPAETTDVADRHPAVVAELRAALEEWAVPPESGAPLDAETEEALRSLGYVP